MQLVMAAVEAEAETLAAVNGNAQATLLELREVKRRAETAIATHQDDLDLVHCCYTVVTHAHTHTHTLTLTHTHARIHTHTSHTHTHTHTHAHTHTQAVRTVNGHFDRLTLALKQQQEVVLQQLAEQRAQHQQTLKDRRGTVGEQVHCNTTVTPL
jgi:nucleoid DNA-binding protein